MATAPEADPVVGQSFPPPAVAPADQPPADIAPSPAPDASGLKRPDITPAQIIGFIPILAKLGTAFGVYSLSAAQQGALTDAVTAGIALFGADALIRLGRSLGIGRR